LKYYPIGLQLLFQLQIIVDLSIEKDVMLTTFIMKRLIRMGI
jgi:hypothetical protein